jgi:hypothetical protein
MWSEWTQCDKFCNGTQFRRKLCICGDDLSCSENYDDSLCAGVPETEVRTCNVLDSCCTWNFTDNWSECMTDNHCCGNGIQWRRQVCLCNDEESDDVSGCLLSGQLPLTETRECSMSDCCQFGPATPISCDQLMKSNRQASDLCITSWKQRDCLCPSGIDGELEPGNFTQCAWDSMIFDNPPISFDRSQDYCLTPDQPDGTVDCNEFLSNGTCAAYTFEFGAGAVISVSDISTGDCHYSDTNCWDGWSDWSPCCGTCDEAYQWRIQTTSTGLNSCRQPPQFEFQNCTIENCCFWTYDDTVEWSSCSVLIGDGFQSRFPYNCSCDDLTLCPVPPDYEIQSCFNETQSCTWIDFSGATSCDIANCFGTPNMTTSNCTSENKEEENTSYGPCEWIEIVSDCEGECTYRLGEYEEEAVDEVSERKRHHDDSGNMIGNGNNGNNGNGNCNGKNCNDQPGNQQPDSGKHSDCGKSENGTPKDCNNQQSGNQQSDNHQHNNEQPGNQQTDSGKHSDCGKSENGTPKDCNHQQSGNQQSDNHQHDNEQPGNQQTDSGKHSDCGKSENGTPKDCNNQQPDTQQPGKQTDSGKHSDCGKSENGSPSDCENQQSENNQSDNETSRPLQLVFTPGKITITRICYCNGLPVDNSLCSPIRLPLVETRDCNLDCKENCTWNNLTDWTDCASLNITSYDSMPDSQNFDDISQLLCLRRECSCRKLNNCDMDSDMDSETPSNFTSPTWSEACGGYDILFMPLPEETDQTEQTDQIEQTPVRILSSEEWKNCSCTWPSDTADRKFDCCPLNWFELLNKQNPNDWESLAVEYITAKLNLLNGVEPDDTLYNDLNKTSDLLNICPGDWTSDETYTAQQLKVKLQRFNQRDSTELPITQRFTAGDEDEKSIITTTAGAGKTTLLLVLMPTIAVAIVVFVGAFIFFRQRQESIKTTNNI